MAQAGEVAVVSTDQQLSPRMIVGAVVGPLLGVALWFAPFRIEAAAHHALAIMVFMVVYWIAEPVDHSLTALIGCLLFWCLHIVKFEVAFSGFADSTPWFLFSTMLMGQRRRSRGWPNESAFQLCAPLDRPILDFCWALSSLSLP